jgi:hypothetical protein
MEACYEDVLPGFIEQKLRKMGFKKKKITIMPAVKDHIYAYF